MSDYNELPTGIAPAAWNKMVTQLADLQADLARVTAERDDALTHARALLAAADAQHRALYEAEVMMRGARSLVPRTDILDAAIAEAKAAMAAYTAASSARAAIGGKP